MSLGNNQNWSSPEGRLLCRRIKDRDLAVVISRCEMIGVNAEAEGHGSKPAGGTRNDRSGRGLKNLVATEIKGDESEKRLARGRATLRRLLIGLEVDVHLVTRTEDSSHARDNLLSVLDEGVDRDFFFFVRTFLNVIEHLS